MVTLGRRVRIRGCCRTDYRKGARTVRFSVTWEYRVVERDGHLIRAIADARFPAGTALVRARSTAGRVRRPLPGSLARSPSKASRLTTNSSSKPSRVRGRGVSRIRQHVSSRCALLPVRYLSLILDGESGSGDWHRLQGLRAASPSPEPAGPVRSRANPLPAHARGPNGARREPRSRGSPVLMTARAYSSVCSKPGMTRISHSWFRVTLVSSSMAGAKYDGCTSCATRWRRCQRPEHHVAAPRELRP